MPFLCNVLFIVNCFLKNKPGLFPNAFSTFLSVPYTQHQSFCSGDMSLLALPTPPQLAHGPGAAWDPVAAPWHLLEMSCGVDCSVFVSQCLLLLGAYVWGLDFLIVSKALFLTVLASSHLSVGCVWDPLFILNFHTDVRLVLLY